jgi:hypothetical protein
MPRLATSPGSTALYITVFVKLEIWKFMSMTVTAVRMRVVGIYGCVCLWISVILLYGCICPRVFVCVCVCGCGFMLWMYVVDVCCGCVNFSICVLYVCRV